MISGFIIVFGKIKTRCWRYFVVFVLIIISISAQALFPKAALQEGHNVFIFKQDGEPLERLLPKRVYRFLKGQFLEQYPPSAWCKSISTGCWRAYKVPDELFVFSADSIFQSAKYSRIVDTIDFSNVSAFRGGFVNDSRYPWYDNASDIQRGTMPFFVMYELSPQSVGSSLCWQGDVLWETTPAAFRHLQHDWEKCRDITESDVGKRIFGISVKKRTPLAIRLILSEPLMLSMIIKKWFRVLMAAAILALTVKFSLRRILVPGVISLLGLGTIAQETRGRLIAEYTPLLGGGDGLGYETLGRQGLISALKGDLLEVLRGGENIFHQMPGLRYFRAFEKFVFGDTNLGYLTVLMVLPIFIYYVFRKFISFRWALLFTLLFMGPWILKKTLDAGQVFGDFYFRYQTFIAWAEAGLAEPFAWIAFLGSIYFILSGINGEKGNYCLQGLFGNMLLALAVFMRPNALAGAGILILVAGFRLFHEGRTREWLIGSLGFLPILFIPLHNYWYGGVFAPLTTSATLTATLVTPPQVYLAAMREIVEFDLGGGNLRHITDHWVEWIGPWYRAIAICIVVWAGLARNAVSWNLRSLALPCLGQHAVLLMYHPGGRYPSLAWLLTFIIMIGLFFENIIPFVKRVITGLRRARASQIDRFSCLRHTALSDNRMK